MGGRANVLLLSMLPSFAHRPFSSLFAFCCAPLSRWLQKQELVNFIIQFMQDVNAEVSELKLAVNSRARVVAHTFLKQFC